METSFGVVNCLEDRRGNPCREDKCGQSHRMMTGCGSIFGILIKILDSYLSITWQAQSRETVEGA
jgi:hypothetical protein